MPKIIPLKLNENRADSLEEFVSTLFKKHVGQERIYVDALIKVIVEFQQVGPAINKNHKNFIPFKKFKGNNLNGLCELRTKKCRYIMFEDDSETYIGLHGFEKKTNETPKTELKKAKKEIEAWVRTKN